MSIITALTRATAAAIVGVGLAAGVAAAAAPAQAAPAPPVQVFGPYSHHQACAGALTAVKGAYAIPPIRQAHGWHEGASFSGCVQVRGRWQFALTAPRVHR